MNTRLFGNTEFKASEVGIGCWQFGGDWGQVSDEDALATLAAAVDNGVNFIDTADVYGAGRSETLIGQFLRDQSEEIFVATKLGRLQGYPDDYSYDLLRECTEDSISRLGVEAIDLTQLHCVPPKELERGEVFEWLRRLQQEGKIKHFGASVESMDEAKICLAQEGLASLQIIFNIFRQKPIDTLFEQAKTKGVALIIRLPLASGLLAGKFDADTTFPEEDHRNYNRDGLVFNVGETFAGLPFEKGVELANVLKAWVPDDMTMAQMALRWILDFDAVSVVIPGAKNEQQATSNAAASDLPRLPEQLHQALARFYEGSVEEHIRGPY